MCVHVCGQMSMPVYPRRLEEGVRSLEARVRGVCEMFRLLSGWWDTDSSDDWWQALLTIEPSLQCHMPTI